MAFTLLILVTAVAVTVGFVLGYKFAQAALGGLFQGRPINSLRSLGKGVEWEVMAKTPSRRDDGLVFVVVSRERSGAEEQLFLSLRPDPGIPSVGRQFIVSEKGGVREIV